MIKSSKSFTYIDALNSSEKKDLLEFLNSPYFNKNQFLVRLYNQLLLREIDPVVLYENVTGLKYNPQKLRYLLSDLNMLIERFLSLKSFENRKHLGRQLLIENLHEKKLNKFLDQHQSAHLEYADKLVMQDSDFLGIKFNAEETAFRFSSENDNRNLDNRLQNLSDTIDTFYFAKKLKYACEMINRSNVLKANYDIAFINEIKTFLPSSRFARIPAVSIYYHILETLTDPENERHYKSLKTELIRNRQFFSDSELKDMFTFAQNYCIRKLNQGTSGYLEELFLNYSFLLDEKIIITNDILSQFDFKNIVTIALRLEKFSWVKEFITSYISYVPHSEQKNAEVYNISRLYYASGDLRKALKLMQSVEFTDVYYHLDAKVLLLKIYYDTNSFEPFASLTKSFSNYLIRNSKVSAYQRETYLHFVKLLARMFNYKMFDKGSLEKIKSMIESSVAIADINWIRLKADELI